MKSERKPTLIDGSLLITEALVASGADMFIGYPITPSNRFYAYGQQRYPQFYPAPDEITVMQWMSGASAAGRLPVTATAFPGLALMVESLNMAYVMELPMVLIVTQRLGPSTGSATVGAQGDLSLVNGIVPGFPIPTFCPSDFEDCWNLSHKALKTAVVLRTPVIILTSKEMVMTNKSFDLGSLEDLPVIQRPKPVLDKDFKPYAFAGNEPAPFLSLDNSERQVRLNASMHNMAGRIVKNEESLSVSRHLAEKINAQADSLATFEYHKTVDAERLIISFGVSALAARDAFAELKEKEEKVSLLILKTIIPLSQQVIDLIKSFDEVFLVEENPAGQLTDLLFGKLGRKGVKKITKFGSMITPSEITENVTA